MQQFTQSTYGLALDPAQRRHSRFLDAQAAFALCTGLRMDAGGDGGTGGGGAGGSGGGSGDGGQGGTGGGQGGQGGANGGSSVPENYATDPQGRSLGYPKDTPASAMKVEERAAYFEHQSQKHEGRYKNLVGNRSYDDTKAALDAYDQIQKDQQTPSEQAIAAAKEEGRQAAKAESNNTAAKAIFEAQLRSANMSDSDIRDLVDTFNVGKFIVDGEIDTNALTTFAARFMSGKGTQQQRDFGGGQRNEGQPQGGAQGKAQLAKRGYAQQSS